MPAHSRAFTAEGAATHAWLQQLHVAFLPADLPPILAQVAAGLQRAFAEHGDIVQEAPTAETNVLIASATFGRPISWREAPFFHARRLFKLKTQPTVFTLMHVHQHELDALLARLGAALAKNPPDPADFAFPGMAPMAYHTLVEQGNRGGAILAALRLLQSQVMCLRILLVVGEDTPDYVYHFDLVGSLARTEGRNPRFFDDIVMRVATAVCAEEIGRPETIPAPISRAQWESLSAPPALRRASVELDKRRFFTEMVRIDNLVQVPALQGAIASQYSEGCFATWEPAMGVLVATITGSARPVDKGHVTDDELAVIAGLRADGQGVLVREVEGKRNDPPSSEAYEMLDIDFGLPRIRQPGAGPAAPMVPIIRSKLHGHRGAAAYNPAYVEFVPLAPAYSRYPVTCGTWAQAKGVKAAFEQCECLLDPDDPRQLAFTLLPTHGVFVVEKWVEGKEPFQLMWEYMDAGHLQIESRVPQGPEEYEPTHVTG